MQSVSKRRIGNGWVVSESDDKGYREMYHEKEPPLVRAGGEKPSMSDALSKAHAECKR